MKQREHLNLLWRIISRTTTHEDAAELYVPLSPVDLRTIPRAEWRECIMRSVTVPPDVQRYLAGQTEFSQDELNAIEDRLSAFHGVTAPYYITAEAGPVFDAWLGFDAHERLHSAV